MFSATLQLTIDFTKLSAAIGFGYVREGESIQEKTRKIAGTKVNEMAAKATGTWDKLEQVFENRVSRALNSLGVPTKADIDGLAKRVAQLTAEVEKLNGSSAMALAQPAEAPVAEAPARKRARYPGHRRKRAHRRWRASPLKALRNRAPAWPAGRHEGC
mgnify:CR=1 FL=1